MQVLSDVEVDNGTLVDSLSDPEQSSRAKARRDIRLNFPGVAAINFEVLFPILAEEVIGWNLDKNCPTEESGYYGTPYAYSLAVEEQGRKPLHGHMTIWIKGYKEVQKDYFIGKKKEKQTAERDLK